MQICSNVCMADLSESPNLSLSHAYPSLYLSKIETDLRNEERRGKDD